MKTLYFISGLGADSRAFSFLNLNEYRLVHIIWEPPTKNENIADYCKRLIRQFDKGDEIYLIGLSFGGIIAQEIAAIVPVKKAILISTIKNRNEFSFQLKFVRTLQLHKLFPAKVLKWFNLKTADYYFSTESKDESKLLKEIILDTDLVFMKWAINTIINWTSAPSSNGPLIHIHGTKDRIFPIGNIRNFTPIKNAGHFMIVNRAKEIEHIIKEELK